MLAVLTREADAVTGQTQWAQLGPFVTPPFLQMPAGQTSQLEPVRMVPVQSQEQLLRTRAHTEQAVSGQGQPGATRSERGPREETLAGRPMSGPVVALEKGQWVAQPCPRTRRDPRRRYRTGHQQAHRRRRTPMHWQQEEQQQGVG